ncbi:MAG: hypothetical protein HEP71_04960 [Roseivirga sp.]|nr:hypothetical protein [Roseivirga sp.]
MYWKVFIILLLASGMQTGYAQKFSFTGTDTAMHHGRGNVHFLTTLEHYLSEENDKPISITQLNTEVSGYILDKLSIGGSLSLSIPRGNRYIIFEEFESNTIGLGVTGFARYELLNFHHHNFYLETGYGMLFTAAPFPYGGTHWNFTVRYGMGYNVRLNSGQYLLFGWRWMHISNGTGFVPTNPAYDGNGIYVGFKFVKNRR